MRVPIFLLDTLTYLLWVREARAGSGMTETSVRRTFLMKQDSW
jgi:hypothetical protein